MCDYITVSNVVTQCCLMLTLFRNTASQRQSSEEDMTDVCVRLKRQMDIMIKVMLMYLP